MIERVLNVDLSEAVSLFETFKWKFFEVEEDQIRIEAPRGSELLVVELKKPDASNIQVWITSVENKLKAEGFIKQTIRASRRS